MSNDVLRSISFVRQVDAGKADWHSVSGPHVAARVLADEVERLTAELAEANEARANLARQCSHHAGLHDGARAKVAELTAEVERLNDASRIDTAALRVSADNAEFFMSETDRLRAEVERLSSAPAIEPGGFRWLTGWRDSGDWFCRNFIRWHRDSDVLFVAGATVWQTTGGEWMHGGDSESLFATEAEAKAAAERWAEETFGGDRG